ncbi:MAG: peptidyl-prolyl cis-trans isomerase [Planctomycetes bacterium]|nr:peptidyl-prolyl cis-trans isomerase [Planctomycetota bacterium]
MKWVVRNTTTSLVMLIALGVFIGCPDAGTPTSQAAEPSVWSVERRRELAAQLAADGLDGPALEIYESLLERGEGLSDKAMMGLALTIADLQIKKARYESALAALYRARILGPEGETLRRIDEKRILCFERLGRSATADRLLDRASSLDRKPEVQAAGGDEVLATVGEEAITRADFDAVLTTSPPEIAARAETPEGKRQILESLVARRVFERKARKLGIHEQPAVLRATEEAARQILVRKMLSDEVKDDVVVKPEDVKLYFEAHRDKFREPRVLELAMIEVADAAGEAEVREALKDQSFEDVARKLSRHLGTSVHGGRVEASLVEGRGHDLFATPTAVFDVVADAPAGAVVEKSLPVTGGRRILKVIERSGGKAFSFDEVKDQVGQILRAERESAAIERLMQEAISSADVTIHGDRL